MGSWGRWLAVASAAAPCVLAACGSRTAELPVHAAEPAAPDPRAPYVLADDAILPVDRIDERTFVVLGPIGSDTGPVGEDFDRDAVTVHPSARVVPGRFRLTGPDGECEGTNGRAVELESHASAYVEGEDGDQVTHYRTSAVEVDADCDATFAVSSASPGRFAFSLGEVERELEYGRLGPMPPLEEGSVRPTERAPIGIAGRFEGGWEFEDHVTCDQEHTMELRAGARRVRIPYGGYAFGLLHVGERTYFASHGLYEWTLHPVGEGAARVLPRLPSRTSVDVDHLEMDSYTCEEGEA